MSHSNNTTRQKDLVVTTSYASASRKDVPSKNNSFTTFIYIPYIHYGPKSASEF